MKTHVKIGIGLGVSFFVGLFILAGILISILNNEATLRTAIEAKHEDNLSEYSNMRQKIKESAQVSEKEAQVITDIILGYTEARGGNGGGGLINAVSEAVPSVNVETLRNLQNIIVGSRNSWTMRQKELVGLSQEHNLLFNKFPSGIILSVFGRSTIDIKILATSLAKKDFENETESTESLFE
jgi:hypothetical protein